MKVVEEDERALDPFVVAVGSGHQPFEHQTDARGLLAAELPVLQVEVVHDLGEAFVAGVTAAATGAIAGAVVVLARRAIVDVPTLLIFAATLACVVWLKRVPEPVVIAIAGIATVVLA